MMNQYTMTETALPFLTAAVPGTGGRIRTAPEDFRVEERPLYLPCGSGEHLYLRVTKRGLSTPQMVARFASTLGVKARCIGVAGLKDANAVTTQMVSVQGVPPESVSKLHQDDRILAIDVLGRHRNRLRTGHHAGNVFHLVVRDLHHGAGESVPLVLEELSRRGLPNYFGPQRQGREGRNYQVGAALLLDEARRSRMPRSKRLWYLHAFQSYLFNRILARRIDRIDRVLTGDWAMKHDNGACFPVEDAAAEQPRADAFAISPTGPLFGSRASWASGEPGEIERAVVADVGATPESLSLAAKDCGFRGERRALRVKIENLDWSLQGDALHLSFALPPGAYATSLLRELMKGDDQGRL
jgi:tRNA pseudouridine13 synthase